MKTTKDWKKLKEALTECIYNGYEDTAVDVVLGVDNSSLEVFPRTLSSIHCMEEVVDFCRVHRLSEYVLVDKRGEDYICVVRIF